MVSWLYADKNQNKSDPHWNKAYNLFSMFWPEHLWDTLAANTNAYASAQGAKEEMSAVSAKQRSWYRTNSNELKVFVGICIYIGLYPQPMTELWSTDEDKPQHPIRHHMAETRFLQLRRFFHISKPKPEGIPATAAPARVLEGQDMGEIATLVSNQPQRVEGICRDRHLYRSIPSANDRALEQR